MGSRSTGKIFAFSKSKVWVYLSFFLRRWVCGEKGICQLLLNKKPPNTCSLKPLCSQRTALQACSWSNWDGEFWLIAWAEESVSSAIGKLRRPGPGAKASPVGSPPTLSSDTVSLMSVCFSSLLYIPFGHFLLGITVEHLKATIFNRLAWVFLRPVVERASISSEIGLTILRVVVIVSLWPLVPDAFRKELPSKQN